MKKNKSTGKSTSLIDLSKQGTLIVGSPRMGTQYLQSLCAHSVTELGCQVHEHGEIRHVPGGSRYVAPDTLGSFLRQNQPDQYRLVIMNHSEHKIRVLDHPELLDDWHVIRLRDTDPYRWFWSWFLFLHTAHGGHAIYPALSQTGLQHAKMQGRDCWFLGDIDQGHYYDYHSFIYIQSWDRVQGAYQDKSEKGTDCKKYLGHHGSSRRLYEKMVTDIVDPLPLTPIMQYLPAELNNHIMSSYIPVDQEIVFQDLPALQNHAVAWEPNDYPLLDIRKIFHHASLLESILDRWAETWPAVFKEKI